MSRSRSIMAHHRRQPSCCCTRLEGPKCEHDSRVPPMPLLLLGGQPANKLSSNGNGANAVLSDDESHKDRMEPLVAFQRKMARCVTICSRYKHFIQDDMIVNKAARLCPCRLVDERPVESAEEKLTKRLAVVLFLARQWHDKEAGRHGEISDVQKRKPTVSCSSGNSSSVREVLTKKD